MPGVITHLAIAQKIISALPDGVIQDEGLFYMGSIAPDAVLQREGYQRIDKKYSHLREEITDMNFGKPEYYELFCKRVVDFINRNSDNELIDLYRGYVVHLLSDELFLISIRPEFVDRMDEFGILPTDIRFRDKLILDMDCHDMMLIKKYDIRNVLNLLDKTEAFSIEGFVTDAEISKSLIWLEDRFFSNNHEITEPIYISNEKIMTYIDESVHNIITRLSSNELFPRMF